MPALFVNGEGMKGGAVHPNIAAHEFLGEVRTAPRYRLYSVRDEFPGMAEAAPGEGASIPGELYEVPLTTLLHRFMPDEPPELELSVIELEDGRAALAVALREEERARHTDITEHGGWRAYRAGLATRS